MELTRRQLIGGAAGLLALGAIAGGGYAYTEHQKEVSAIKTIAVPEEAVLSSVDCTEIEDYTSAMTLASEITLPYGTLVWSNDDKIAAALVPTETGNPLLNIALIDLAAGSSTTVLDRAVASDEGFEIYDVRANANGMIWIESNILEGRWRVYGSTSPLAATINPYLLDEGDANWEMPTLAAVDQWGWWQVLPRTDGDMSKEKSVLKRSRFGTDAQEIVYESSGRMSCAPYADSDSLVITPRAGTSGTYYQLTRLDAQSGDVTDAVILPASMTPQAAGYGQTGFNFTFDAIYSYGDGIANLGTYTPLTLPGTGSDDAQMAAAYSDSGWFRFARTPLAPPAWCNSWFMVKSTQAVCGVDLANQSYFALPVQSGSDSYGDYLATTGTQNRIVTYTNVDYTSIAGDEIKHSLVRVWQPVV